MSRQVVEGLHEKVADLNDMLQAFVQECLTLVTRVARLFAINSQATSAKFWRALLAKVYDILDKVSR